MEFENTKITQEEDYSENYKVIIRELIDKYLRNWKWFVLAFFLSVLLAYYNLNFARSLYQASGTIKIKDSGGGDRATLSVFEELGMMSGSKDNIEDEIEIISSKSIISEVVKSLGLNVKSYTHKNRLSSFLDSYLGRSTEFYERERYADPPLKINFLVSDSILYRTNAAFLISISSSNNFIYSDVEKTFEKRYAFGEKIVTSFGDIIITPNVDLKENDLIGNSVLFDITSVKNLTNSYSSSLEVEAQSQFSTIIGITFNDGVQQKAEDFINELVKKYNDRAIYLKDEITKSTSDFVTKRLEIISEELSTVDLTAESLKTRYRLSDAASNTGLNMQSGQEIENQIVQAKTQLQQIESIKNYVTNKGDNEFIPVNVGVSSNNISTATQQYNELMMEKKRLLENSTEKNPIVVNVNEQLKSLKNNINQGLNNLESSQKISIEALSIQDSRINSRLYSAPKQERQIRDIQRQQLIKEELYLYLLKKREETAITLGVVDSNAKIIDAAESKPEPIAPKKLLSYLSTIIMGMLIPLGIIYFRDLLNTKIHTREDVEKVLKIPIIADIPKETKNRYLITNNDYSSTAEAFRILRTNLGFILPGSKDKKSDTIFITSTIAHEGKSLVATNLAASLAHAGKRTLILGMDIRAPKIKSYLGVRGKLGVTNYIVNLDIKPEDIILQVPDINNLYVASSGDIAPNPAELLMNPRVKDLFNYAKENFDYIIVDTAAYSMVTDTLLISHFADAFIYILRANFLDKRYLKFIKTLYNSKRLPNMALLINGIDFKKAYAYGYGYGYGTKFEASKNVWSKFKKS